jgi:hypothetical protein
MDFESIVRISAFGHNQSGKTGQNRPAVFHFSLLFVVGCVTTVPPSRPPLPLAVHRSHPSSLKALSACVKRLPRIFAKNQRKISHFGLKNPLLATFGPQKSYIGHLIRLMAKKHLFPFFFAPRHAFKLEVRCS